MQQLTDYTLTKTKQPWIASLVAFIILLVSKPADAQLPQKPTTEHRSILPGVNIVRKGTTNGVVSDSNGSFEIAISHPKASDVLVFSFIGLQTKEVTLPLKSLFEIEVNMTLDITDLTGEVIIMGGVCSTRWYSPRRVWWRVRGWFR